MKNDQDKVYVETVEIFYEDTDHSGVVYHPNFLKYFDRARTKLIGAETLAKLWNEEGVGFAVYKSNLTYQEGVEFADICQVKTRYHLSGKYKTVWRQELWRANSNKAAVVADIELVCLDKEKKLQKIPPVVFELLGFSK